MTPQVSIVLPCFNEAGNIKTILEHYRALLPKLDLELILVNNGSTDSTAAVMEAELKNPINHFARDVTIPRNIGYGHGLQTGLTQTKSPVVGISHADLQCPPENVLEAYELFKTQNAPSLVKGKRRDERAFLDRMVTFVYNRLTFWLLKIRVQNGGAPDVNGEPKLFDRSLLDSLNDAPADFTFDLFLLNAAKKKAWPIVEFEVPYRPRLWGKSKLAANPWVRFMTSMKAFKKIWELRGKAK